jgi:hypothetical protein
MSCVKDVIVLNCLLVPSLAFFYIYSNALWDMAHSLSKSTALSVLGFLAVIGTMSSSSLLTSQQVNAQASNATSSSAATAATTPNQTAITTPEGQEGQEGGAAAEEEGEEEGENLFVSQHIPLTGQLLTGDYILLMDFTPFKVTPEGHSHIAIKVPCNETGGPEVTIVTGVAPNFTTLDMGSAISNGTLNGNSLDLSNEGTSCLYHADIPANITDIALVNTSDETLDFDEGGYSVTVSAHAVVGEHEHEE